MKTKKYDEEKIVEIYNKYSKIILNISFTYLKSTSLSEDMLQEVLIKYIKKSPKFESLNNEKAWFIRVTINLCKDYLKSAWIKKRGPLPESDLPYLQHYECEILEEINKLPDKYRILIYLYYYEKYTIKEIAKILKEKENTIGIRLSRAREKLKIGLE